MPRVSLAAAALARPLAVVLCSLWLAGPSFAQLPPLPADSSLSPTVLPALSDAFCGNVALPAVPRQPPVHLFLMQPAFLYAPVGLDADEDGTAADPTDPLDPDAELAAHLQVSIGNDNPFFDFQSPDNPGRVGYYKLHAQYQVVDTTGLSLCLGLQAFTPAGLESDGLARGPTVLRPNFSWWQDMGNGCGLNGFVCKSVLPNVRLFDRVEQGYRCGLAWVNPLTDSALTNYGSIHFFMEAVARYQPDSYTGERAPSWEVLPGLHWQVNDNCWLSGAVVLPVGPARTENGLWQITCWWKF